MPSSSNNIHYIINENIYGKKFEINKPTKSCFDSRAKAQSQIVFVTIVGHHMSGLTPTFAPNVGPKRPVCELVVSYLNMFRQQSSYDLEKLN
jgi:hypothetical protein